MDTTCQYITIDSKLFDNNNNFVLNFMQPAYSSAGAQFSSNLVLQEINNVIGLKIVDFYVANNYTSSETLTSIDIKYIDVQCSNLPSTALINDQFSGILFERIYLERDESTVYSKTYKPYYRKDTAFNPIPLSKMEFKLFNLKGGSGFNYSPLDPNVHWSMMLEVTSLNPKHIEDELTTSIKSLNKSISRIKFIPQYLYTGSR